MKQLASWKRNVQAWALIFFLSRESSRQTTGTDNDYPESATDSSSGIDRLY
jgi:hypothetical protein